MANRIPYFYYTVINENNIENTTDINIVKTKETKNDNYTSFEYEVSYKLNNGDKYTDMKDYIVLNVIKDERYIIDDVYFLDKTSSIFSEYNSISQ